MNVYDLVVNQPIVIDNGSGVIKAGFAGDEVPKCVIPNYVAYPKHQRVMVGALEGEVFVGPKAVEHRGLMCIRYPMEHGVVIDWDDMEKVWGYVYSKEQLNAMPSDHPVLITEAPLNPVKNRERMAEIFFEGFSAPSVYVSVQAVLSLYASGRTTGVVLDSGDGVTHTVPVYEGFALPHSIVQNEFAGRDVTKYLQLLLRKEGFLFRTTSEFEVVRQIKEKACSVSPQSCRQGIQMVEEQRFVLPDGNAIEIGRARRFAPEILFTPELAGEECSGIHEALATSILKSDLDLRPTLCCNIVLAGGSTLFKGFGDRLLWEMRGLLPKGVKLRISAPQERLYSTWIGGSILASLDTFKRMWVSRKEYTEEGTRIIHRKMF